MAEWTRSVCTWRGAARRRRRSSTRFLGCRTGGRRAIAIEGSPQPAIDTDRIFAANFTNVPVLWISAAAADQEFAGRLKGAGLNIEWRSAAGLADTADFRVAGEAPARRVSAGDRLRDELSDLCALLLDPDHEVRCRRAQRRTRSTRLAPAPVPSLDLGGFGYKLSEPGPGVLITFLPEKYSGPLKMGDRIVALDGRPIADAKAYLELMAKYTEEKPAVVTVQRGKDRNRVETRVMMPRRDATVTARVQGQYVPADREIQIVSRTIKEMRVTVPPQWAQDANCSGTAWRWRRSTARAASC